MEQKQKVKESGQDMTRRTIEFWQPCYRQTLTPQDASEIISNVTGFFRVLVEWDRKVEEDDRLRSQEPTDQEREVSTRGDLVRDSALGG